MTPTLQNRRSRRPMRLRGYEYASPGAYFVTICTHRRENLLGYIDAGQMHLNEFGAIVCQHWSELPVHYPHVGLDAFVVMPNHIHGILVVYEGVVGAGLETRPYKPLSQPRHFHGLPEIVRGFKTYSARAINELRGVKGAPVWQRSFFDHIIRDERSLNRIRGYIENNPGKWAEDRENPDRLNRPSGL